MAQQDFQGSNGAVNFSLNVPDELGTLDPNSELYGQIVSVYTLGQSYQRLLASAVGPNANSLREVARSQQDSADNLILSYESNSLERALLLNTFQAGEISVSPEESQEIRRAQTEIVERQGQEFIERQGELSRDENFVYSREEEDEVRSSGAAGVALLLNRTQGVLATLNERIIKDYFSANDVRQNYVIPISSNDEELLVNYLLRRPNLLPFFNMSTPYLSLLVPKIRLFKRIFEIEDDGEATELRSIEFKFNAFTSNAKLEQITSNDFGRSGGVGIKSVNWSYEGTNPEEVSSFINCDISLFFQSLSDLITTNAEEALVDIDNVDLIQLFGAGIGFSDTDIRARYNFEIVAELGWALNDSINEDLGEQRIDEIKRIINDTNVRLRLRLKEHNINFNDDGTLTVDISYFSALDEVFTDEALNVLAIGQLSAVEAIQQAREEAGISTNTGTSGERETIPELDPCARLVTTGGVLASEGEEQEREPTQEEIEIFNALTGYEDDNIIQNYNSILNKIIQSDKIYRATFNSTSVINAVIDEPLRSRDINPDRADASRAQEIAQRRLNRRDVVLRYFTERQLRNMSNGDLTVRRISLQQTNLLGENEEAAVRQGLRDADVIGASEVLSDQNLGVQFQAEILERYAEDFNGNSQLVIDFIRLGDLIDNIIDAFVETPGSPLNQRKDEFKFITGLFIYRDIPRNKRIAYNYSDMLISIDAFRAFFLEKIVKPLKTKYNLVTFIIDLANKFSFVQSLRTASQQTFVAVEGRPTFSVFQGPDVGFSPSSDPDEIFKNLDITDSLTTPNEAHTVGDLPEASTPPSIIAKSKISYFILRSNSNLLQRDGDENEDILSGIYHLKLGSDRGILKSAKFRRDEIRGRREGRIVRAGGLNLTALREKYDVSLTIFGASFIFPGMFLYLNPSLIGYGSNSATNSAARVLGLGGYYFVNKVSHSINDNGNFETQIEASWNSFAGTDCGLPELEIIRAGGDENGILGRQLSNDSAAGTDPIYPVGEEGVAGGITRFIDRLDDSG